MASAAFSTLAAANPGAALAALGSLGTTAAGEALESGRQGVSSAIENVREKGILHACDRFDDFEPEDDLEQEEEAQQFFLLRMCVHSGKNIQALRGGPCRSKVKLTIAEGLPTEKAFVCPAAACSHNPMWEFQLEHRFTVSMTQRIPSVSVKVLEVSGFIPEGITILDFDTVLGAASIELPQIPEIWPTVSDLKLSLPTSSRVLLNPNEMPQVKVVWDMIDVTVTQEWHRKRLPSLIRMAELDLNGGNDAPQEFCVQANVYDVTVEKVQTSSEVHLQTEVAIVYRRSRGIVGEERRSSEDDEEFGSWQEVDQSNISSPLRGSEKFTWHDREHHQPADTMSAPSASWSPKPLHLEDFKLRLPGYHLQAKVLLKKEGGKVDILGSWEERLDVLLDRAEEGGVERFRASLRRSDTGATLKGELEMSVDVFSEKPHGPSIEGGDPRVRGGFFDAGEHAREQDLYITVFGDQFLVAEDLKSTKPFIKLIMGSTVVQENIPSETIWPSPDDLGHSKNAVRFEHESIHISVPPDERQLRLQVWNSSSNTFGGEDLLVCEAFIPDVVPNSQTYWRHCYAGSIGSRFPYKSLMMARNFVHPSTYRGTLAIDISSLPMETQQMRSEIRNQYERRRLTVRLHRGLYVDQFRGKEHAPFEVSVLVAVAGCSGSHARPGFVLLFSGDVDHMGTLRFKLKSGERHRWVSQRVWLDVPPRLRYAYVYIVKKGQEDKASERKILGRLRLRHRPAQAQWKELHYDESMANDRKPSFLSSRSIAGCILGAAWFEVGRVCRVHVFADDDAVHGITFEYGAKHGQVVYGSDREAHGKEWYVPAGEFITIFKAFRSERLLACSFVTSNGNESPRFGNQQSFDGGPKIWEARDGNHITGLDVRKGFLGWVPIDIDQEHMDECLSNHPSEPSSSHPPTQPKHTPTLVRQGTLADHHRVAPLGTPSTDLVQRMLCCAANGAPSGERTDGTVPHDTSVQEETMVGIAPEMEPSTVDEKVPDEPESQQEAGIYFCHIDLLAGRCLFPPSDCHALMEQCPDLKPQPNMLLQKQYKVRVEDQVLVVERHSDPKASQCRRLAIPISLAKETVEPETKLQMDTEPPPPVMVEVVVEGSGGHQELFGVALIRDRSSWWRHDLDNQAPPLNLNLEHDPFWYLLDSGHTEDFKPSMPGGILHVFRDRPRLLMAVLFSRLQNVANPVNISSAETQALGGEGVSLDKYVIEVDILGLRQLDEALRASRCRLGFSTASLWNNREPQFIDFKDPKDAQRPNHRECVASIQDGTTSAGLSVGRKERLESAMTLLDKHCVLFQRDATVAPLGSSQKMEYTTVVIPYLQPNRVKSNREYSRRGISSLKSKRTIQVSQPSQPSQPEGVLSVSPVQSSQSEAVVPSPPIPEPAPPEGRESTGSAAALSWLSTGIGLAANAQGWLGSGHQHFAGSDGMQGAAQLFEVSPSVAPTEQSASRSGAEGAHDDDPPFVLLPEILFHLHPKANRDTKKDERAGPDTLVRGATKRGASMIAALVPTGTLTLRLPVPLPHFNDMPAHQNPLSRSLLYPESPLVKAEKRMLSARELETRASELAWRIPKAAKDDHEYAEFFVDVFAACDGWLSWDRDFRLGRSLRGHKLFSIKRDEEEGGSLLSRAANAAMLNMASVAESSASVLKSLRDMGGHDAQEDASSASSGLSSSSSRETIVENDGRIFQYFNLAGSLGCPRTEPLHVYLAPTLTCHQELNPPESSRAYSSAKDDDPPGVGNARSMLGCDGGWVAKAATGEEWVEIALEMPVAIRGVVIHGGHHGHGKWVKGFRVETSTRKNEIMKTSRPASRRVASRSFGRPRGASPLAGQSRADDDGMEQEDEEQEKVESNWHSHGEVPGIWHGPTHVHIIFQSPVESTRVRIYPLQWEQGVPLRVGLLVADAWLSRPFAPKELYAAAYGTPLSWSDFRTKKTIEISNELKAKGFRAPTHLAAPEPLSQDNTAPLGGPSLERNLHTFVRPVGHVITKHSRDSRLLARLRMDFPKAFTDKADKDSHNAAMDKLHQLQEGCHNFLCIKFVKPGTVIWAPPRDSLGPWTSAGEVLFVVRLNDGSGQEVTVRTPSFDIRFSHETAWYPRKTLTTRWRSLYERMGETPQGDSRRGHARFSQTKPGGADQSHHLQSQASIVKMGRENRGPAVAEDSSQVLEEALDQFKHPAAKEKAPEDGYNRPIRITKHAFVCRLRKRGLNAYDRRQSQNWWRAVYESYGDVGPELDMKRVPRSSSPAEDVSVVKAMTLRRLLNLRATLPLLSHTTDGKCAVLKGHVRVRRCSKISERLALQGSCNDDEDVSSAHGAVSSTRSTVASKRVVATEDVVDQPNPTPFCPVDNLWIRHTVRLSIYVLSIEGAESVSKGLFRSVRNPFVAILVDDKEERSEPISEDVFQMQEGVGGLPVYWWTAITVTLPGPSLVRFQVKDTDMMNQEHVLGETSLDVEDRWLALVELDLVRGTRKEIVSTEVMPRDEIEDPTPPLESRWPSRQDLRENNRNRFPWISDGDLAPARTRTGASRNSGQPPPRLHPMMRPPVRAPLETRALEKMDPSTGATKTFGKLRYFIDMLPMGVSPQPPRLELKKFGFHIHVKVWDVEGISVFRDIGQRNDVLVDGHLEIDSLEGVKSQHRRETDCHKWATNSASFNQQWSFGLEAPVVSCQLILRLLDVDAGGLKRDMIYRSEVVALDHLINLAYRSLLEGGDMPGEYSEEVVFGSWPPDLARVPDPVNAYILCIPASVDAGKGCARFWTTLWGVGSCGGLCDSIAEFYVNIVCCPCRYRAKRKLAANEGAEKKPPKPARLRISVLVEEVNGGPDPTEETIQLFEPKGRIGIEEAINHPGDFIARILGPNNMTMLMRLLCATGCLGILIVAILLLVALNNIKALS